MPTSAVTAPPRGIFFARAAAAFGIFVGLAVILCWLFFLPQVSQALPNLFVMKFNTALAVFALGIALGCALDHSRFGRIAAVAVALVPLAIGLLNLAEHLSGKSMGIDQWLVRDPVNFEAPGRISILTSGNLVMLAVAVILAAVWEAFFAAQTLAVVTGLLALLSVLGYTYGIYYFVNLGTHSWAALHTAATLLILSLGVLHQRTDAGLMHAIYSPAPGGTIARRLIPGSVTAVLLLGVLRYFGHYLGWVSLELGMAIVLFLASLTLAGWLWFNALLLNRADERHERIERERSESDLRFRRLYESNMLGIFFYDLSGTIFDANDYFLNAIGYSRDDLLARKLSWKTITPPSFVALDQAKTAELVATGLCTAYEKEYLCKDGSHLAVIIGAASFQDLPDRGIAYMLDISAQKRAEESAARHALELERSNRDLEQFAYVASHDLQEPLRMVSSFTQLLKKRYHDKLDAEGEEYIDFAVDGARRMQGLINDLLEFSRVSTSRRSFALVPADAALDGALRNLHTLILETGARIERQPLPDVRGDPGQLTQLFQNLVGNALKYRGAQPPLVSVNAALQEGEWRFRVADNGIGIKPEYFARIFVIFQRLHPKSEYPGTGIGLALCKKIVERHGGRIWVESAPGSGSTFYFTLKPTPSGSNPPALARAPEPVAERPKARNEPP